MRTRSQRAVTHMHVMSTNQLVIMFLRVLDVPLHFIIQHEFQFLRRRNIRSNKVMFGAIVDITARNGGNDKFVHAQGWRSVHAGVLTYSRRVLRDEVSIGLENGPRGVREPRTTKLNSKRKKNIPKKPLRPLSNTTS